jgi:hypothetical protein
LQVVTQRSLTLRPRVTSSDTEVTDVKAARYTVFATSGCFLHGDKQTTLRNSKEIRKQH